MWEGETPIAVFQQPTRTASYPVGRVAAARSNTEVPQSDAVAAVTPVAGSRSQYLTRGYSSH